MSKTDLQSARPAADAFGRNVAARLSAGAEELPYEVRERLRAARVRALQVRQAQAAPVLVGRGPAASLAFDAEHVSIWRRLAGVIPLLVLLAGLVALHSFGGDRRASELAEVDQALLTDDLPPAAYADPGFVQFLKTRAGRE